MPGVPDVYQGTEGEYLALVDPDNRRVVGFPPEDSGDKGALTAAALRLRRRRPEAFGEAATYEPLAAEGPASAHCVAFARSGKVVTAVTRLSLRLAEAGGWRETVLPRRPGCGATCWCRNGSSRDRYGWRSCSASRRWPCWSGWVGRSEGTGWVVGARGGRSGPGWAVWTGAGGRGRVRAAGAHGAG